jgi:hypothetical protein
MTKDVFNYCKNCKVCNEVNITSHKPPPLEPMPIYQKFGDRINIDLLGPLPKSIKDSFQYLLVMSDSHSRYMELVPLINKTAIVVAEGIIKGWITCHSCFKVLGSDLGSENKNKIIKELQEKLGFKHIFSSVSHPNSNGLCERKNRDVLNYLRKYLEGQSVTWPDHLPALSFSYNTTVHSGTQFTPFFLAFGRRPVLPSDHFGPIIPSDRDLTQILNQIRKARLELTKHLKQSFDSQKRQFDKRSIDKEFKVGDKVFVKRAHSGEQFQKFQKPYKGEYTVVKLLPHNNLVLWDENSNRQFSLHKNLVKLVQFEKQSWDEVENPLSTAAISSAREKYRTFIKAGKSPQWFAGSRKFIVCEDDENIELGRGAGRVIIPPVLGGGGIIIQPAGAGPATSSDDSSDDLLLTGSDEEFVSFSSDEADRLLRTPPNAPDSPQPSTSKGTTENPFALLARTPVPKAKPKTPHYKTRGTGTRKLTLVRGNVSVGRTVRRIGRKLAGDLSPSAPVVVRKAWIVPTPPPPTPRSPLSSSSSSGGSGLTPRGLRAAQRAATKAELQDVDYLPPRSHSSSQAPPFSVVTRSISKKKPS